MASDALLQIGSVVVVILIFATLLLSKKLHYFVAGLTLIAIGSLGYMYENGMTTFNIDSLPVLNFAAYFFVLFAGKDLLIEGFKEKENPMKWPSLILAIVLILFTTVNTLHKMSVIDIYLDYPPIVSHVIYIISGLFLIIGIFTLLATSET
ncbi:MAG: hypothetical protein KJ601_07005 [Nanoarchaeota archaeon]|nr:hypothetical protein [Nanoarchaeota archaeon]MBU1704926.1 hypothetical protein [Nanoarchaeota archaeon]